MEKFLYQTCICVPCYRVTYKHERGNKMVDKKKECNKEMDGICNTYKSGGYYATISINDFK